MDRRADPERDLEALRLRQGTPDEPGLSYREIGERLGMTESGAWRAADRAGRMLKVPKELVDRLQALRQTELDATKQIEKLTNERHAISEERGKLMVEMRDQYGVSHAQFAQMLEVSKTRAAVLFRRATASAKTDQRAG